VLVESPIPKITMKNLIVTVDKSHIVSIGEKLYSRSVELVRELVNNAYDADATHVDIHVDAETITVDDNGSGMDLEGLRQYFNIGSPEKRLRPRSPRFGRLRIGQFGIGKFATLSACEQFEVLTQSGEFRARVVFDKDEWAQEGTSWALPLESLEPDPARGNGTRVSLIRLTKHFEPTVLEEFLRDSVPLSAPDFEVRLNGGRILARRLSGHRIPFMQGTEFGIVNGEIVILPVSAASAKEVGIDIKVRQVTIRRDLFGLEREGREAFRIRGEIHADFLPVTTDRSGFVTDSPEYRAFRRAMEEVAEEVRRVLERLGERKENRRASRALREAIDRVAKALEMNPDLSPFGAIPFSDGTEGVGGGAVVPDQGKAATPSGPEAKPKTKKRRKKKTPARRLSATAVVRRMRKGAAGVTCCLDHFGETAPESFSEESIIYINRDHPLYLRNVRKTDTHTLHIARLLTQELALMKDTRNPRLAFQRQSLLLTDAFREKESSDAERTPRTSTASGEPKVKSPKPKSAD
jgi:hypothetical protein